MATRKTAYAPNDDADFLKSIQATGGANNSKKEKPQEQEAENAPDNKKLFNIKVSESLLKEWKQFCINNDITLTYAIKKAMKLLIKGVNDNTIEL